MGRKAKQPYEATEVGHQEEMTVQYKLAWLFMQRGREF